MSTAYYEVVQTPADTGISFSYQTVPGGYHPLHWHEELELLYPLNGSVDINVDHRKYQLPTRQLMAVESCKVHSTFTHTSTSMFLCIHISKKYFSRYIPDIELYQIDCNPNKITDEMFPFYLEICQMMEALTRLYIKAVPVFRLEAEGIILQVLAHLLRHFSANTAPRLSSEDRRNTERIRQVISYVEEHFREPVSLSDISEVLGLGKEYFCRFFKKHMGISFLNYLNEVRLTHIYQDLEMTDLPVTEIMEKNGITNQKLFNRNFKELYGCTPSAVRKTHTK